MTHPPKGNGPHDSRAEEAIDWYQHYMAVGVKDLALDYMMRVQSEKSEPPVPMEKAVEARQDEALEEWMGGED